MTGNVHRRRLPSMTQAIGDRDDGCVDCARTDDATGDGDDTDGADGDVDAG